MENSPIKQNAKWYMAYNMTRCRITS